MTNLATVQAAQLIKAWIENGSLESLVAPGMAGYLRSKEILVIASSMHGTATMLAQADVDPGIVHIVHDPSAIAFSMPSGYGPNAKMVIIDNIYVAGLAEQLTPELEKYLPWSSFGLKKIALFVDPDKPCNNQILLFGNATSEDNVHHPIVHLLRYTLDGDLSHEYVSPSMNFDHFLISTLGDSSKRSHWTTLCRPAPQDDEPIFFNLTILSSYLNLYRELVLKGHH